MQVLHVIPSLDRRDGGPSFALPHMAASLAQAGVDVHVATTIDPSEASQRGIPLGQPVPMGTWTCHYFPRQSQFYKVSLPLMAWLKSHVRHYALVHVHALFSFAPIAACRAARRAGVPYIVRPLGLLNQWGMQNRRRNVKALSFRLVERPLLNGAAAIHYTSATEQQEASALNLTTRPVIIPLGIDTSLFHHLPDRNSFEQKFPEVKEREVILYLSRLDPKKGLEVLLRALDGLVKSHPKTLLIVAGSGSDDYTATLRQMVDKIGIRNHVLWTGFLGHEDKRAALAAADVFVLPSKSENFGIALLEAMAAGKPCVATSGVALGKEAAAAGVIRLTGDDAESMSATVAELLDSPPARASLGRAAQALADDRYSLEAMGTSLAALYKEIVQ